MEIDGKISLISGIILGADGVGGSGVCVQLADGGLALLTAKHVLIECLRNSGKIKIAAPKLGISFQTPQCIIMDSSQSGDAAHLRFHNVPPSAFGVPYEVWTDTAVRVNNGDSLIVAGYPKAFKRFDSTGPKAKVWFALGKMHTKVLNVANDRFECLISEDKDVPKSFEGMSGGGVFSSEGRFLGIIVSENRNLTPTHGELSVLTPIGFKELYSSFKFPPEVTLGGYHSYMQTLTLRMYGPDFKYVASVAVTAEFRWSKTNPEHKFGRVGRLVVLEFQIPDKPRYPINIESLFYWYEDTEEARKKAMTEEVQYLLLRIGWLMGGDDDNRTIKVQPMV